MCGSLISGGKKVYTCTMIFIIFLNGEEEEKLLGIRKSVFSSWFVLTIGKPELINFNSQIHFRLFKRGWQF